LRISLLHDWQLSVEVTGKILPRQSARVYTPAGARNGCARALGAPVAGSAASVPYAFLVTAARIFAALDGSGNIRFIGDVPSGAGCRCFCSVCGSPLVARQGAINTWHFAHEASQERPECIPGALNLLWRLAVEHLRSLPQLVLPRYQRTVRRNSFAGLSAEEVGWDAQPRSIEWREPSSKEAPVATLLLDNGISADLFIEIPEQAAQRYPSTSGVGKLVFSSSLPVDSDLRKEIHAREHLQRHGVLAWLHQPDAFGLLAAAGLRPSRPPAQPEESVPAAPLPDWARYKKPNRPFFGYRLDDGTTWVFFELARGGYGIRCVPGDECWHEAMPPSVGRLDEDLQLLVAETCGPVQQFLETRRTHTCIGSDFGDVLKLAGAA
jgi:hypothetical protein